MALGRRILRWLGDDLNFFATCLLLIVAFYTVRIPQIWMTPVAGAIAGAAVLTAVLAIGRWGWGRWICFALVGAAGAVAAYLLLREFSWRRLIMTFGLLWYAKDVYRWAPRETEEDEADDDSPFSLVALLREHGYLDDEAVARAAMKAWGVPMTAGESAGDATENFVAGDSPIFILRTASETLIIHHRDQPYFSDSEQVAESIWEVRHKKVVLEHRAWLSVDALQRDETADDAATYSLLGKLLAELIDEQCLAVLCPREKRLFVCDEETDTHLRSDDPIAALDGVKQAPIVHVADDDPRMLAAVAEARRRWPEFEEAFDARTEDQTCSVKFPLREGDVVEFIWATVTAIENDVIYGTLGNDPMHSRKKLGDRVQTRVSEINDWIYFDAEKEMQGGFTVKVLTEAAREKAEGEGE